MDKRERTTDNDNYDTEDNGETREQRKLRRSAKKAKKDEKEKKRSKKQHRNNRSNGTSPTVTLPVEHKRSHTQMTTTIKTTVQSSPPLPLQTTTPSSSSQSQHRNESPTTNNKPQQLYPHCNDDDSNPFQRKKARLLVSLLPASLRNIKKAINGAMQSLLLRYSYGVGGVLLAFDNIEIEDEDEKEDVNGDRRVTAQKGAGGDTGGNRYGRILDEMPHIHFYITSNILVFNPIIGQKITGVVNEAFPSHVGILVYDLFNAMVSADSLREGGFSFDSDLNEWSKVEMGIAVQIEDSMIFTVEKIHECNGTISLEGSDPSIVGVSADSDSDSDSE